MGRSKKTIGLPLPNSLKSNNVQDLQNHLRLMTDALNDMYKLLLSDINTISVGSGTGTTWIYFGGIDAVGSARIGLVGTDWVCQHYISGTYTTRLASSP